MQRGFTLIELSIVLVIIGLVSGGVLTGRDMIKASEIRGTMGQLESYTTAVQTFRDKYRNLPGDLTAKRAVNSGFAARSGNDKAGDGDGIIETPIPWSGIVGGMGGENLLFWRDLATASLVAQGFTTGTESPPASLPDALSYGAYMPATKIHNTTFIEATNWMGQNYYVLGTPEGYNAYFGGVFYMRGGMTPLEAFQIDAKRDDGNPLTGAITSSTAPFPGTGGGPTAPSGCLNATNVYNTADETLANEMDCAMFAKAGY